MTQPWCSCVYWHKVVGRARLFLLACPMYDRWVLVDDLMWMAELAKPSCGQRHVFRHVREKLNCTVEMACGGKNITQMQLGTTSLNLQRSVNLANKLWHLSCFLIHLLPLPCNWNIIVFSWRIACLWAVCCWLCTLRGTSDQGDEDLTC